MHVVGINISSSIVVAQTALPHGDPTSQTIDKQYKWETGAVWPVPLARLMQDFML